uniref:C9orf128 protein n=1 Tax=Fopius arisanus TaxID=64838 RepID=A0A0C9RHZ6_9HYME
MMPYLEHRISTPTTTPLSSDREISMVKPNINIPDELVNKYEDVVITTEETKYSVPSVLSSVDERTEEITTKKLNNHSLISYDDEDVFSFDSMLDLLFSPTTVQPQIDDTSSQISTTENISTPEMISNNVSRISPSNNEASNEKMLLHNAEFDAKVNDSFTFSTFSQANLKNSTLFNKCSIGLTNCTRLKESVPEEDKNEKAAVNTGGGLLKLAGCNIYGRMYRVGRIIVELSTPCLECRCTDLGVQCKQLEC